MIRINLLPPEERPSKWPVNRLLGITALFIFIMLGSIYGYGIFQIWGLEKQLQDTRNQYQLLQPTQVIMVKANDKQQLINKKNSILTVLTKDRQSWYGIIQHLTAVSSPQVWFTDMVKSDKGIIQIKGWSATYLLVAEFMNVLEKDQFFTESALGSVEKDPSTQVTKFEILVKPREI